VVRISWCGKENDTVKETAKNVDSVKYSGNNIRKKPARIKQAPEEVVGSFED
jgi:hypothetical protein